VCRENAIHSPLDHDHAVRPIHFADMAHQGRKRAGIRFPVVSLKWRGFQGSAVPFVRAEAIWSPSPRGRELERPFFQLPNIPGRYARRPACAHHRIHDLKSYLPARLDQFQPRQSPRYSGAPCRHHREHVLQYSRLDGALVAVRAQMRKGSVDDQLDGTALSNGERPNPRSGLRIRRGDCQGGIPQRRCFESKVS